MSQRTEVQSHLRSLNEISAIMGAMKSLAMLEIHKLSNLLSAQQRVVSSIEVAADDFLTFHPDAMLGLPHGRTAYLLIGSERGFCGNFNERLIEALGRQRRETEEQAPRVITVGRKLAGMTEGDAHVAASLDGATVAEEIPPVLMRVMRTLHELQALESSPRALNVTVLYHDAARDGVAVQALQAFRKPAPRPGRFTVPPLLNAQPLVFLADLIDFYLFAVLHTMFYSSLMAENRHRLQHMERAMQRLDENIAELKLTSNRLRQEEITEDIEVIMLSAEALGRRP